MTGDPLAARVADAAAAFRMELSSNKNYSIAYDLQLSDPVKLAEKTDNCLNTRRLMTAAHLIDQQFSIDVENPMPHAQLGRYYFLRSVAGGGNQKWALLDKALASLKNALELAKRSAGVKAPAKFHHMVSEGLALALTQRAHIKYETGDMAGAARDLQDSLKYDLPDEVRNASRELLDFMKQEAAEATRYSNRKAKTTRRVKPGRKNPSQHTDLLGPKLP